MRAILIRRFQVPPAPAAAGLSIAQFHTSSIRQAIPLFALAARANSRETLHFSKSSGLSVVNHSPTLELLRSSEVDPFQPKPKASRALAMEQPKQLNKDKQWRLQQPILLGEKPKATSKEHMQSELKQAAQRKLEEQQSYQSHIPPQSDEAAQDRSARKARAKNQEASTRRSNDDEEALIGRMILRNRMKRIETLKHKLHTSRAVSLQHREEVEVLKEKVKALEDRTPDGNALFQLLLVAGTAIAVGFGVKAYLAPSHAAVLQAEPLPVAPPAEGEIMATLFADPMAAVGDVFESAPQPQPKRISGWTSLFWADS